MARLASRAITIGAAPVLLLTATAGCATTQQEAARLQLGSARIRATQVGVRVRASNPEISVQGVGLVAGRGHERAIVVRLRNLAAHPVSDLPISVGVIDGRGHRTYLNAAAGIQYFLTHIPAVPAGGSLTWVFTTRRALPPGARPFAVVGREVPPLVGALHALPKLAVTTVGEIVRSNASRHVRVTVRNLSSIPQYGLQVYVVARRTGRYVSAGRATIDHLGQGASTVLDMALVGAGRAAPLTPQASPTVFG